VKRPQSNGIVERFHRTLLDEHFRVEGRRTWFDTVEEMQAVLDEFLIGCNTERPHQGRNMNGRKPAKALVNDLPQTTNRKEDKASQKSRLTPPAQRGTISRLPSVHTLTHPHSLCEHQNNQ
jgi:transposase InsO family protein